MESEQMNEFRPLILVAEDDDSNFKLIKAIIGKKCDIEWAKKWAGNGGVVSTAPGKNQSNADGYQDAGDERVGGNEDNS